MRRNERGALATVGTLARVACAGLAAAGVIAAGWTALRDARLGRPTIVFDYSRLMAKRLPRIEELRAQGRATVAVLGASSLVSYPEGRTVPDRLQERVPQAVVSLGVRGSGPFDIWALSDEIAAARPDGAVIAVHLDHFSDAWVDAYARPALAGFVAPGRLGEALSLPLDRIRLSVDQLLASVALVRAGAYEPWYWLTLRQAQVDRARAQLEARLQGGVYVARNDTGDDTPERVFRAAAAEAKLARVFTDEARRHYRPAALQDHYATALAGVDASDPTVRVLGAILARFRAAGIRTLLYLEPIELGPLERAGLLDETGLGRTAATLEAVARAHDATFVDLHAALPDTAFRDAPGHLAFEGAVDGPALLADLLAPRVSKALSDSGH